MIVKGQKINDRYEVKNAIGEGGMANVYLAKDTILDRDVAVKVLRGDLASDEKFVRRFQREALSASSLTHRNIVEIYDVGEDNGDYYIVMEYIPGKDLKQLIKRRGSLTVPEVIDIMLQITEGMIVAHDALIVHRDLKPQNIIIMDDGMIKITDFGIAMALNATQLTQTNSAMGSVHYFPPEQANGKGSTLKSDVYSLGIMMYELLSGTLPFRGDNAVEIALKHLKEPIKSIRIENPNIPQSVENILINATAKNPKNRYASAKEMHEDLLTVLNEERLDEPKKVLKYSEGIEEEVEYIDRDSELDQSMIRQISDKEDDKNKKIIIIASVIGGLILAIAFFFILWTNLKKVPDVTIPNVTNLTAIQAEKKLKAAGFEVNIDIAYEPSEEIEKEKVLGTEPAQGRTVKKGTKITIIISSGVVTYEVPDFTGKNYIEVKTELEKVYKIKVEIEEKEVVSSPGKTYDPQEIIGQSVDKGNILKAEDKIILYIPKVQEKYPDIVKAGWSVAETEKWAEEKGLILTIKYVESDTDLAGTIIKQDRAADSVIVKGASFSITVTKLKEMPATDPPEGDLGQD